MPTSSAPDPAPRGKQRRRNRSRVVGLLVGWALILAWLALLGWNIATVGFPAPLSRLIALPSLPGLPLAPALAAQVSTSLFALMIALFLYLCALTLRSAPPRAAKPALPPIAPAVEPPAVERLPADVVPLDMAPPDVAPAPIAPAFEPAMPPALAEATLPPPSAASTAAPAEQTAPATDAAPDKRLLFISHASGDNAFGYALTDWLQAQLGPDWIVWYDSHGAPDATGDWPNGIPPASDWMQEIQRQVMACAVFVVIETKAAMESYWVQREVELAWTRKPGASVESGLVVVPVRRETCELLPLLSLVQY
ncbi:MAG TPA: TIR domain-containing protein, partial [Ktedonobacterales bacterium]|nr:TIR domain-containing protein [Ktedonobacterales bacterium]